MRAQGIIVDNLDITKPLAKPTAARLGVAHVDMDDAVTLKTGGDGAQFVDIDMSKTRVLYNDDPLIKTTSLPLRSSSTSRAGVMERRSP